MKITNKLVTLKAFKTLAWGIGSIKVRGVEYLDMHDDGRGFQSSYRPKAKGEAYNPTQHGSSAKDSGINDGKGFSHSVNHFKINDQLAIYTDTQMAYFRPVRGKTLSNFRLRQWVSLHALGYWNVIRVNNKLIIPKNEPIHKPDAGVWEAMCAYVSSSLFSDFYFLKKEKLVKTDKKPKEQKYPIAMVSKDGNHAIGVYANGKHNFGKRSFHLEKVMKINAVRRIAKPRPGEYDSETFFVVGNKEEVRSGLQMLVNYHNAVKGGK